MRGIRVIGGVLGAGLLALTGVGLARTVGGAGGPALPVVLCRAGADPAPLTPGRMLTAWQADPVLLALLALLAAGYLLRARRLHGGWPRWRAASFLAGLGVVALAVTSAVAVYDMTQFWAHMVQHLMLIMLAPPLLVAGRPLTLLLATARGRGRARLTAALESAPAAVLTSPAVALAGYAAAIVGAHLTGLSTVVMTRPWAGQAEHLVYVAAGVLFFWLIFGDEPIRWQLSMPGRLMLLVLSMAVDTFVGLVLLQTTKPVAQLAHPGWGLAPLADTQAGGAVMWVAGDGLMAVLAVLLFATWARRPEAARRAVSFFERARAGLQAERGSRQGSGEGPGAGPGDMDADDAALEDYNRWLAGLHRNG